MAISKKGILIPSVTTAERDSDFSSVPNGFMIYNSTTNSQQITLDGGSSWQNITTSSSLGSPVLLTGDQTINGNKTFSNTISADISGNAATVTDGVYTSGSYSNPFWLTSLDGAKLTGTVTATSASPGSITNTMLAGSITASKLVLSDIVLSESQVTNLTSDLAAKLALAGGTMVGNLILNSDPSSSSQAATKNYVDMLVAGFNNLTVNAASTASITGTYNNGTAGVGATFTVTATGAFSLDGQSGILNGLYLLKDQSSSFQNGVYQLTTVGSVGVSPILTRPLDYDSPTEITAGDIINVALGTTNGGISYLQTNTVTTVGTDPIEFTRWGGQSMTFTGDVSGNGFSPVTLTIGASKVTNAMLAGLIDLTTKVTGILPNANTTADSANTINTIVTRDGSGNFSAGTITASLTGNSSTATKLATSRNIGNVAFDGSASIVPQTIQTVDDVTDAIAYPLFVNANGTQISGQQLKTNGGLTYDATTNKLSATTFGGNVNGNAFTADALSTPRLINDVSFDGTSNITVTADAGTLTGTTLNSTVVNSSLTSVGNVTAGIWNANIGPVSGANLTNITPANISFGTITSNLAGNATTATTASTVITNANLTGPVTSVGNATSVTNNAITDAMIRQSAPLSVIANATNATANVADLSAASDFQVLRRSGTALAFGAVNLASSNAVTGILPNANTSATTANTASTIVARDGSGNFSAGTITAALSGNATTATTAATVTTNANLTGDVTSVGNATTLATVNSTPGTFGLGSNKATFTLNAKGLITGAFDTPNPFPTGYINNLTVQFASTTTLTLSAGSARDSLDTYNIVNTGSDTINIAVNGVNGLDTGTKAANTWYAVFVIGDSAGVNPAAGLLSLSAIAPTMPSGYDKFRRVGWVKNNASNLFKKTLQHGVSNERTYYYDDVDIQVLGGGNATVFTAVSCASEMPPTSQSGILRYAYDPIAAANLAHFRPTGSTVPQATTINRVGTGSALLQVGLQPFVTNSSQSLDYLVTSASDSLSLVIYVYHDSI